MKTFTMPAKVVIVGWDSASLSMVERLLGQGVLPTLQRLRQQAVLGRLESPPGLGDDAAWATFSTGYSPAVHSRFYFRRLEKGSYEYPMARDGDLKAEPFWAELERQGKRCAVIDVPKTALVTLPRGAQLCDWLVHGRDGETRSWPPDLAGKVLASYGDDLTDGPQSSSKGCALGPLPASDEALFLQHMLEGLERKTQLALDLLRQEWDLFLIVFKESHCAGHQFWHTVDPSHPRHDPARADHPLDTLFATLDGALARILESVGEATPLLLFSDLDMGPNYHAAPLFPALVDRLEETIWPRVSLRERWTSMRARFSQTRQRVTGKLAPMPLVRGHRRLIALGHNEMSGALRFNIVGRDPLGKIQPGAELESAIERLTEEFHKLTDSKTGLPVVEQVLRVDKHYTGENLELLPDLLVVWRRESPISGIRSPSFAVPTRGSAEFRPGNHLNGGFYLARGPGFPAGQGRSGHLQDLSATAARWLEAKLTNEGRPLQAD